MSNKTASLTYPNNSKVTIGSLLRNITEYSNIPRRLKSVRIKNITPDRTLLVQASGSFSAPAADYGVRIELGDYEMFDELDIDTTWVLSATGSGTMELVFNY